MSNLKHYSELTNLKLANNHIKSLSVVKELQALEKLQVLDLSSNPVNDDAGYSEAVREIIPSLEYLDGKDANGNEYQSDDDEEGELEMEECMIHIV